MDHDCYSLKVEEQPLGIVKDLFQPQPKRSHKPIGSTEAFPYFVYRCCVS